MDGDRRFVVERPGEPPGVFRVHPRETLRDALVRRRVPHRSVCGGSAICGTCWVEVRTTGIAAALPDEQVLLDRFATEAERPRLACRLTTSDTTPEVQVVLRPPATST